MVTKQERRNKIKTRIRGKVSGTAERPRMTVFRSNKQIYVQLVDDSEGKTLASHLVRLTKTPAYNAVLVADNYNCREAECTSTLCHLSDTVDGNQTVLQFDIVR